MRYFQSLRKTVVTPIIFLTMIYSCSKPQSQPVPPSPPPPPASDADLVSLPKDAGGTQTAVLLNDTDNKLYGYYVYTPSGYNLDQQTYPLLIFLHGSGEIGNSMTTPTDIKRILTYGPPSMINKKTWSPKYPMIVVSPQSVGGFLSDTLNEFMKSIISRYRVNTHRIYLTGLSLGGAGTFKYLTTYSTQGYVAAAAPMSAAFENQPDYINLKNIPIWTFCGESDKIFPKLAITVNAINQYSTTLKTKFTAFPGVGHNCWDLAYSGTGIGKEDTNYDAFKMSIYDWMFQYSK